MVFSGLVNWPNRELKQRRFWTAHVNRKWGLFHFNVPSCDATTFVLRLYFLLMNLLMNAKSPLVIGVRRSKTPLLRTVSVVNQHNQNFRFEFSTTSGSEWISISRSSQTNTTTSWGKSKLLKNCFWVVFFPFSPNPRTYRELRWGEGKVKKWFQGRSWRVAAINVPLGHAFVK